MVKSAITGVGGYVPESILSNKDLEQMVDTTDDWILTRTGIKERRILKEPNQGCSTLAVSAAQDLIEKKVIDPKSIDVNAEKFENLIGNDANFNADKMIEIFKGKDNDFSKAVCLNAAAGLMVSEKYNNFELAYNLSLIHI